MSDVKEADAEEEEDEAGAGTCASSMDFGGAAGGVGGGGTSSVSNSLHDKCFHASSQDDEELGFIDIQNNDANANANANTNANDTLLPRAACLS